MSDFMNIGQFQRTNMMSMSQTGGAIKFNKGEISHPLKEQSQNINEVEAEKTRLRKAAEGFEAIFIRKLLSSMQSTLSEGSMFGSGSAGSIYSDIADAAVADTMASQSILGLADRLYVTMVKGIESKYNTPDESMSGMNKLKRL